jgi:hypothetical protein
MDKQMIILNFARLLKFLMLKKYLFLLVALVSLSNLFGQVQIVQSSFVSKECPQVMASGNSTRLPVTFKAQIFGLAPMQKYKYYVNFVSAADFNTTDSGRGGSLFMDTSKNNANWRYTASPSMFNSNHDTLTSSQFGGFEGYFSAVHNGDSRFTAGKYVYPMITIEEIGGGALAQKYALDDSIKVLSYSTSAGANNGTGIYGTCDGNAYNIVKLYDNVSGSGDPIAMTFIESDGATIGNAVGYYSSNVDGKSKRWGTILPNTLDSGIRRIEQVNILTQQSVFANKDADGNWGTSKNTVSPRGGSGSPFVFAAADAPLVAPSIGFSTQFSNTDEGVGTYNIYVKKKYGNKDTTKFNFFEVGGSTTKGKDYTITQPLQVPLSIGYTTTDTIKLPITDDNLTEGSEVAVFKILSPVNGERNADSVISITIKDNDTIKVSFLNKEEIGKEDADSMPIHLLVENNHERNSTSVDVTIKSMGVESKNPGEFRFGPTGKDTTVMFSPGQGRDTLVFYAYLTDDSQVEDTDTFELAVRTSKSNILLQKDSTTLALVKDSDTPPNATFLSAGMTVNENDKDATVTFVLENRNSKTADVVLSMLQSKSTAQESQDFNFTPSSKIVSFDPADPDTATVTFSLKNDEVFEGDETIVFALSGLSNAKGGPIDTLVITIKEDDYPNFDIKDLNGINADGEADSIGVKAVLSGVVYGINTRPLGNPQGFEFVLRDDNAGIQAFSPSGNFGYTVDEGDSISIKGTIGQFAGMLQIQFIDTIYYHKNFATLKTAGATSVIDETTESDLVILENCTLVNSSDWPVSPLATNTVKDVQVQNANGTYTIRIDSDSDIDGTTAPTGFFDVTGLGIQSDLTLPYTTNYMLLPRYKGDIVERTASEVTISPTTLSVSERWDDSTATITVSISNLTENVSASVVIDGGTATSPTDYTFVSPLVLNFTPSAPSQEFKVQINDNQASSGNTTLELGLDNLSWGLVKGADSSIVITIIDDETSSISDLEKELQFSLFPNPSTGVITVSALKMIDHVKVVGVQGNEILNTTETTIDLSSYAKGIYTVEVEIAGNVIRKKVLLK